MCLLLLLFLFLFLSPPTRPSSDLFLSFSFSFSFTLRYRQSLCQFCNLRATNKRSLDSINFLFHNLTRVSANETIQHRVDGLISWREEKFTRVKVRADDSPYFACVFPFPHSLTRIFSSTSSPGMKRNIVKKWIVFFLGPANSYFVLP